MFTEVAELLFSLIVTYIGTLEMVFVVKRIYHHINGHQNAVLVTDSYNERKFKFADGTDSALCSIVLPQVDQNKHKDTLEMIGEINVTECSSNQGLLIVGESQPINEFLNNIVDTVFRSGEDIAGVAETFKASSSTEQNYFGEITECGYLKNNNEYSEESSIVVAADLNSSEPIKEMAVDFAGRNEDRYSSSAKEINTREAKFVAIEYKNEQKKRNIIGTSKRFSPVEIGDIVISPMRDESSKSEDLEINRKLLPICALQHADFSKESENRVTIHRRKSYQVVKKDLLYNIATQASSNRCLTDSGESDSTTVSQSWQPRGRYCRNPVNLKGYSDFFDFNMLLNQAASIEKGKYSDKAGGDNSISQPSKFSDEQCKNEDYAISHSFPYNVDNLQDGFPSLKLSNVHKVELSSEDRRQSVYSTRISESDDELEKLREMTRAFQRSRSQSRSLGDIILPRNPRSSYLAYNTIPDTSSEGMRRKSVVEEVPEMTLSLGFPTEIRFNLTDSQTTDDSCSRDAVDE